MLSIATTTLIFSAFLSLPTNFATQYCVADEPMCARMHVSPVADKKVDVEALDRTNGEFMRTRWLAPGVMARTIWTDGVPTCVVMHRDEQGRLMERDDANACLDS